MILKGLLPLLKLKNRICQKICACVFNGLNHKLECCKHMYCTCFVVNPLTNCTCCLLLGILTSLVYSFWLNVRRIHLFLLLQSFALCIMPNTLLSNTLAHCCISVCHIQSTVCACHPFSTRYNRNYHRT